MGPLIGTIAFIFVLIWAFRLEIGITKANESLKRIEEELNLKKENK